MSFAFFFFSVSLSSNGRREKRRKCLRASDRISGNEREEGHRNKAAPPPCGGGSLCLIALSTVAVGYANWNVGPKLVSLLPSDELSAEEAIDARIFSNVNIATFKTAKDGIFSSGDSNALILSGEITASFSINTEYLDTCGYLSSGVFSFVSSLKPADSSFLDCLDASLSYSFDGVSGSVAGTATDGLLSHALSVEVSSSSSEPIEAKLIYTVKEASRGYIYSTFGDMSLSFLLKANKAS